MNNNFFGKYEHFFRKYDIFISIGSICVSIFTIPFCLINDNFIGVIVFIANILLIFTLQDTIVNNTLTSNYKTIKPVSTKKRSRKKQSGNCSEFVPFVVSIANLFAIIHCTLNHNLIGGIVLMLNILIISSLQFKLEDTLLEKLQK